MIKSSVIGVLMFSLLTVFVILIPSRPSFLAYVVGTGAALLIVIHFIVSANTRKKRAGKAALLISMLSLSFLFILLPVFFAAALYFWGTLSFFSWMLLISLCVVFYINFLCIPLAIYQKHRERKQASLNHFPSISILIPAYNEEKVLRRAIETTIEATYPSYKEIIIIDDGSTDMTYSIAQEYNEKGVKIIHRPNGGKAVAINHGLRFAEGEIIIIVDADSLVGKNTLIELVQPLRDREIAAVAGNIKVLNRTNWLTRCQALEYIASINVYRRALDMFGSVTVVPGALGAYRREVLEGSGLYDPDTLVEDFDVTMKTLKTGKVVQASTTAIAYTEAPQTLGDLIKQRLRWYRGNFQALWKHRDAAFNARYGFLQKLAFPFLVVSMVFTPFAGVITLISAVMAIAAGEGLMLLPMLMYFFLLQFLLSLLAIELDNEDIRLTLYTPLFIFGYKQLCDFTMIKGLFDVILHRGVKWTNVRRIGAKVSKSALS
jgi:cellulose synthase/poly-beta-1,6-N-acetylglucosamine synthase-like glycosyltransferase